jgi:hypothetical protein
MTESILINADGASRKRLIENTVTGQNKIHYGYKYIAILMNFPMFVNKPGLLLCFLLLCS